MSTTDAAISSESDDTGAAFEVAVESDGDGQVAIVVQRTGISAQLVINTPDVTDEEVEEFFRLLPAVVDRGLDAFVAQTTQEGTPQ